MPAILMLLAAVVAAGGDQSASPPQASQATTLDSATKARERATYESLLAALRQKRAEIAQSPLPAGVQPEARHYALEFLDRQIEKIRKEMEQ
jgi:hypothetical protein